MSEDLVIPAAIERVVTREGTVLEIDNASPRELAQWLDETRALKMNIDEQRRAVMLAVLRRMDKSGKWTLYDQEYVLIGASPARTEWNAGKLYDALQELVGEDLITQGAAESACRRSYTYKASAPGVNALLKLGGAIEKTIRRCGHQIDPATRRVEVKLKAPTHG